MEAETPARETPPSPDADFHAWAAETARALRERRFEAVDWNAVAEELEDMGRSEKRELESRLGVLIAHLIKWRKQPDRRSKSWSGTIKEQRRRIARPLGESPSLNPLLAEAVENAYGDALAIVEREAGIEAERLEPRCPWEPAQILAQDFWPE